MTARPRWIAVGACLSAGALAACTTGGTLDYIPKRPLIESTHTELDGPRPASKGCPERSAPSGCPFERIHCAFDDRGCELCSCGE